MGLFLHTLRFQCKDNPVIIDNQTIQSPIRLRKNSDKIWKKLFS